MRPDTPLSVAANGPPPLSTPFQLQQQQPQQQQQQQLPAGLQPYSSSQLQGHRGMAVGVSSSGRGPNPSNSDPMDVDLSAMPGLASSAGPKSNPGLTRSVSSDPGSMLDRVPGAGQANRMGSGFPGSNPAAAAGAGTWQEGASTGTVAPGSSGASHTPSGSARAAVPAFLQLPPGGTIRPGGSSNGGSTSSGILQSFLQLPPAGFSNGHVAGATPRGGRPGSGYATVQQAAMAAAAAAAACSAVAPAGQGQGGGRGAGGMGSQVGSLELPGGAAAVAAAAGSCAEPMDSAGLVRYGSCSGVTQATSAAMMPPGQATPQLQAPPLAGTKRPLAAAEGLAQVRCDSMPLRSPTGAAAGAPGAARGGTLRGGWLRQALSDTTAVTTPDTWRSSDPGVTGQHLGFPMIYIKTATSDVVSWGSEEAKG
jgi:hypothetical protein